jgi:hypothetical protein
MLWGIRAVEENALPTVMFRESEAEMVLREESK